MSRAVVIALLVLVAAVSTASTVLIVNSNVPNQPPLTEQQRTARQKFFGSGKELPPIKDGQEMRPRW
ncbi:entry exclusion protein TrbK [Sinorhizobium mexicanum]|uniref:Entry exclusion protein TrbK n=1 Tax=Sinorhizobium mexicanum TaxID=375549 RepID=A0A859QXH1_9HYPH|nr:entry exclusion protein TrbK [Sinorhizobium mexicanum]MBP1886556.1 Ti type entry exclusion protein TrbK [Sinorhizobium mexicanum]QLL64209.1 entry exclusion protein TrbK [Sinorhizobium mexicanum]